MTEEEQQTIHVLWINGGLSCDGDSVSLTAATQPSIEEIALGAFPGLPKVAVHWPFMDFESGPEQGTDNFVDWFHQASRGELDPFVLVVEGSVPNEDMSGEGYFSGFGRDLGTGQPITINEWLDRLASKATIVLAVGTCATYGGIHGMAGSPTGAIGVPDYLGWDWKSKADIPIVCVPGCPAHPDNLSETILYLLYQIAGQAPMIPLDDHLRPRWLFNTSVHEGCDRAGYYEQGDFAESYDSPKCLVKLGCQGQAVTCNVPKRGWINGVGGCPNVGGICIGCTMPGFPDQYMPFMDTPRQPTTSSPGRESYRSIVKSLRDLTLKRSKRQASERWRDADTVRELEITDLPEDVRRELDRLRGEHAEAHEQSIRDELTNSYNRRYLDQQWDELLAAESTGAGLAVALTDLDFFKQVNDTYGHPVGDQVLQQVVEVLRDGLPEGGFCARFGGEEFVLVLPDVDAATALLICEAARARVEHHPWHLLASGLRVTVSIGLAWRENLGPVDPEQRGDTAHELVSSADQLLYLVKQSGRNAVAFRTAHGVELAGAAAGRRDGPGGPAAGLPLSVARAL